MSRSAYLLALTAIALWSTLATLGTRLAHLPPFTVVGLALTISGLLSLPAWRSWRVPLQTFLVGVGGIFGYHYLYFSAFRYAPAVEANLINYLWPLLIVLLAPLVLPGTHLRARHILGALMGLAGAALITLSAASSRSEIKSQTAYFGYLLMSGSALTWAVYSLMTRRLTAFPTGAVGGFCLTSGLLALTISGLASGSFIPAVTETTDWINLVLIGTGPMGAAFFAWDAALKRGDPRIIGTLSYLTPLASTLLLITLGGRTLSGLATVAMSLIVCGALVGSVGNSS